MFGKRRVAYFTLVSVLLTLFLATSLSGSTAVISKSVKHTEEGNFLVTVKIEATKSPIYAVQFLDPKGAIIDSYAPSGWCTVSDDGQLIARTGDKPAKPGETIEITIHSTTDVIHYTWIVGNRIEQLGNPGTL